MTGLKTTFSETRLYTFHVDSTVHYCRYTEEYYFQLRIVVIKVHLQQIMKHALHTDVSQRK